jgi:hypothetical protein
MLPKQFEISAVKNRRIFYSRSNNSSKMTVKNRTEHQNVFQNVKI